MGEAIMCEYIRKQTVLNMIDNAEFDDLSANTAEQAELFDKLHYAVNSIESVDAVEVVRRRDCKHSETLAEKAGTEALWCEKMFDLHGFYEVVKPNHYCGYGKRKEETDNDEWRGPKVRTLWYGTPFDIIIDRDKWVFIVTRNTGLKYLRQKNQS